MVTRYRAAITPVSSRSSPLCGQGIIIVERVGLLTRLLTDHNLRAKRLYTMSNIEPATMALGKHDDRDEKDMHPLDDQLAITSADDTYGKHLGAVEEHQARE